MASSSDVVKKVMRFKLQLTDTADSATIINILQKLKDLDITLDILAETGIGKTINSLRRHELAGEFAKTLVKGWKKLLPKKSTSLIENKDLSESLSVKDKLDDKNCTNTGSLTIEDLNNNCLTSHSKSQDSSDEASFETRKADPEKQCQEQKRQKDQTESQGKSQEENQNVFQNVLLKQKIQIQEDKMDESVVSKWKKNSYSEKSEDDDTLLGNKHSADTQKSMSASRKKIKSGSDSGRKSKKLSKESKESFSFESCEKFPKMLEVASVKDESSSGILRSSEARQRKRKKPDKHKEESEQKEHSKHKRAKINPKEKNQHMSFESFLNYDVNVSKRKERCGVKKPTKKKKNEVKSLKSPVRSISVPSPKQTLMDLMRMPLPAVLPQCEKPFSVDYFEKRVEKEPDFCDVSEDSAVFTGQRLNKKMQVYSGAKTIFLPTMMSLYQQCIRTLQNNINLLYETGGVPFDILEPVLERCTPEQLLRIEEFNPIYIGATDHLWGKHCQRDFKDSRLQEYESWKEMYIRLSEERERKLQRLTKSIVSAQSKKPKGRQVKMAFIHTVAKPPRDVRIQQEIHGTAVQQPQLRCSVKVQDNRMKQSCNDSSRSSSMNSGASNTQDPRKKTRVAPMMAKSLKAFKKQLGRR